jgi:diguanylate cyclase (GGDEF)-like protein
MHKLLLRQLKRYSESPGLVVEQSALFAAISEAYEQQDRSMKLLEGSLYLTSKELNERNDALGNHLLTLSDIQDQLLKSITALNAIFDATGEIIFSMDNEGRLLRSNKMGHELLFDVAKLEGSDQLVTWSAIKKMLLNPEHVIDISHLLKNRPNEKLSGTLAFKNGHMFEYYSLPQLHKDQLIGRVWCLRDVTEEKKNEKLILHQAFHDALTGLPNRNYLLERIVSAIESSKKDNKKIAVIFIDFDNFKKINDTEGHEAGDELLRTASRRIKDCIRDSDFLSRLGGDEFVIVIEGGMSQTVLTRVCSAILNSMAQPFLLNKHKHYISCSMGISIYPRDDDGPEGLIGKADMAMYRAKELGKNSFQFYSEELERLALYQLEFESSLRFAIANDQLTVYFQPEVDLKTNKIVAAEALVRWIKPNGTLVPPDHFIPIAEQSNLIGEVGHIVFEKVCKEINRWKIAGIDDITVAINVSAREFQDKNFVKHITKKLSHYKISGERIVLEITESLFMEDKEAVLGIMSALRKLGIRFAIDDFGTGYSSFSYLQDLPIQYLKVDRSFLKNVVHDKKQYAIARSIIDIGNHLELMVIAEGIEDQDTLNFIIDNNCAMAQGYFLYRPMSIDAFAELLGGENTVPVEMVGIAAHPTGL